MPYRHKTYVCFADADRHSYELMTTWPETAHLAFHFVDAHELAGSLDPVHPEAIRRRLRGRLVNTTQAVLLVGDTTRAEATDPSRLLGYELEALLQLDIPIVVVNLNQSRDVEPERLPEVLSGDLYTVSVPFQPKAVQFALDNYVVVCRLNPRTTKPKVGPHAYPPKVYRLLGI